EGSFATHSSFRGAGEGREPGIHNHDRGVWIPGLRQEAHPGMTKVRWWKLRRALQRQHTAANLVFLDRFEQRLEVAFAEAVVALALDELEEDRPEGVGGKDLPQHLGVAAFDPPFAVDQDAIALQPCDVLTMIRQPRIYLLEIGLGRRRHDRRAGGAEGHTGA